MMSLERSAVDPAKDRNRSDGGQGVQRLLQAVDYDDATETARERAILAERESRLFEAEMRLNDAGKAYLIPVLLLIAENGSDRDESLKTVPRATYFLHRKMLIEFFA